MLVLAVHIGTRPIFCELFYIVRGGDAHWMLWPALTSGGAFHKNSVFWLVTFPDFIEEPT